VPGGAADATSGLSRCHGWASGPLGRCLPDSVPRAAAFSIIIICENIRVDTPSASLFQAALVRASQP